MTTDFRALCVELTDCLEKADWPHKQKHVFQQWTYIARKALAEPEGREPAAVTGQPSDEEWDALVERVWDAHQTTGYQGERFMWDRDFDSAAAMLRDELARWGTPNLAETRRSLKDAWAAHQPAIEAAAKAGMDACRVDGPAVPQGREPASVATQPSDEEIEEWADACPEAPLEEMDPEVHGWRRCFTAKEFSETIRVALARWGRPAHALPVPGEVTS